MSERIAQLAWDMKKKYKYARFLFFEIIFFITKKGIIFNLYIVYRNYINKFIFEMIMILN